MASNPPGKCCTVGVKHEYVYITGDPVIVVYVVGQVPLTRGISRGTPTGKMVKVAGKHDAYLATPPADKARKGAGILLIPDIFGIWQNSQLIADQFAANGYLALLLDIFNGDAVSTFPPGFDVMSWIAKGSDGKTPHTKEAIDPIIVEGIQALRGEYGVTKLGAVGYCFGAKVRRVPGRRGDRQRWLTTCVRFLFSSLPLLRPAVCCPALQGWHRCRLRRPPLVHRRGRARGHHGPALHLGCRDRHHLPD